VRIRIGCIVAAVCVAKTAHAEPPLFLGPISNAEDRAAAPPPSRASSPDLTFSLHAEAAVARPIGEEKTSQFGWGGIGTITGELALHPVFGVELGIGAVVLSDEGGADPEGVAPTGTGIGVVGTIGPRLHPLAPVSSSDAMALDGLWIAGGFGGAVTGDALRPTIRASLGWDVRSAQLSAGPFVGYLHVIEPDEASLRPEDLRAVVFGLHGSFDVSSRRPVQPDAELVATVDDPCAAAPNHRGSLANNHSCPDVDTDRNAVMVAAEADSDNDGVPDAFDACPDEKETHNGILDGDGCPDTLDLHVEGDRIVLDEHVQFSNDSATLTEASVPLLERVALFLNAHPEYEVIRVAGHTDASGPDAYNLKLSASRALSVRDMLVKKGVAPTRFRVMAFGETRPLDPTHIAPEDKQNRRVEFEIIERRKEPR
jgi:outer membrane protein OmpA-like peptidoglycan-associated protein